MKRPGFWDRPAASPGWQARVFAPLGALYAMATAARIARGPGLRADVPVICVGNLNLGGTGKTPTVIALIERLTARGLEPHVVSRGYGGSLPGPVLVDERQHSAADVGDEPLLLAAFANTWVSKDRAAGVRAAQAAGAQVILLDDGFQNPAVAKDFSIIVVDAKHGFGNGRVAPAGPLREPVQIGLKRADMVLVIGSNSEQVTFTQSWGAAVPCPRISGELLPLPTGMDWHDLNVLAFAGIGRPARFFATLRQLGANLIRAEALDDHQPLNDTLMKRLEFEAGALNAQLVTTEKDAVRLPTSFRQKVLTLPVRLDITDWSEIDAKLTSLGLLGK